MECLLQAGARAMDACVSCSWETLASVCTDDVLHLLLCYAIDQASSSAELTQQLLFNGMTFSSMIGRVCR